MPRINLLAIDNNARIIEKSSRLEEISNVKQEEIIRCNEQKMYAWYHIENLFDGITDNNWQTDLNPEIYPVYCVLELPKISVIDTVIFFNNATGHRSEEGNSATKRIELWASMNNKNNSYNYIGSYLLQGPKIHRYGEAVGFDNDYSPQSFNFQETKAKYIKIIFKKTYWDMEKLADNPLIRSVLGVSLSEIKIIGYQIE